MRITETVNLLRHVPESRSSPRAVTEKRAIEKLKIKYMIQ